MKIFRKYNRMTAWKRSRQSGIPFHLLWTLALSSSLVVSGADIGTTFATPEEAVSILSTAANAKDTNTLQDIFGPVGMEIQNPDAVQAANELELFTAALNQTTRIVYQSETRCWLEVGDNFWPFPVPIAKRDGRWFFDTEAGKDELLTRRIGRNELNTLLVVRAHVEAQREYAAKDRDGDQVLEYAQKFLSTPGTKDGLYWHPELDGEISPLGPLIADAQELGYDMEPRDPKSPPRPFNGYIYKILVRQSNAAPGGSYDYIINGNMIGGFAMVAWPAEYGDSGIMTFILNQQGRVYQKDLGPKTANIARKMKRYDPDKTWAVSPD
jgi:hypothetical protein